MLLLHSWSSEGEEGKVRERDIGQCLRLMDAVLASQPASPADFSSLQDRSINATVKRGKGGKERKDDGQAKQTRREKFLSSKLTESEK